MANYEQLFLLEVLVDKVKLLTRALAPFVPEDENEPETPTRIRVKFSDFPCFEITRDLAPPDEDKKDGDALTTPIVFSSGKSCMFSMDPEKLIQDLIKYPMAVTVFKKNPECPLPDIIGQCKVRLSDYMSSVIKRAAEWWLEEPLSEKVQDTFPLRNARDQDVGTIDILVRLTCFGKIIITKFQIAGNKNSFLFKNAKTQDYEFRCEKCTPGRPIMRPKAASRQEEEDRNEEGTMEDIKRHDMIDKEQMTDDFQEKMAAKSHIQGSGFQRDEIQGPKFTASTEIRYPEERQNDYGESSPHAITGLTETQSVPIVKKEEKRKNGKEKARGKSLDSKKMDIENGVELEKPKKRRRSKFHVQPGISYPGVILGHKYCVDRGPPIPAKNGWAWKTTVPLGMKWEDMRGRKPGSYLKEAWGAMKEVEELRRKGKRKRIKRKPVLPDSRKPTIHLHRIKGVYHVTMNPMPDKEEPEPVVYAIERPEGGSDASEIQLDLTLPETPYPPPPPTLRHQAQQFCEEDLPLILPKPVFVKKKKKKERSATRDGKPSAKKGKPSSAKSKESDKTGKGKGVPPEKGAFGKGGKAPPPGRGGKAGPRKGAAPGKGGKQAAPPAKASGAACSVSNRGKQSAPEKGGKPESASSKGKGKMRKKGDDDDVYPWDDWIMKLKCKRRESPDD